MTARYAKIVMTACLSFFAFLVALTNITDYSGNQPFVQHVLSMDTTFRDPDVAYRAITAPWIWTTGYLGIIAGEALTALLMGGAAVRMFRARQASARDFDASKSLIHLAALSGFLVWFLGFMAIGGEWFLMWQSATWNGQEAAFRFYVSILLVLIYVSQSEHETVSA
jgi:predicted small integral membrane protein